jgi:hypothetical protein
MIKFPKLSSILQINENVYSFKIAECKLMLKRNYSKTLYPSLLSFRLNKRFVIEQSFYNEIVNFKLDFIPLLKFNQPNYFFITNWIENIYDENGFDEFVRNYKFFQNLNLPKTRSKISKFSSTNLSIIRYLIIRKLPLFLKLKILFILIKCNLISFKSERLLVHNNLFNEKNIVKSNRWYLIDFESIRYDKFSKIDLDIIEKNIYQSMQPLFDLQITEKNYDLVVSSMRYCLIKGLEQSN